MAVRDVDGHRRVSGGRKGHLGCLGILNVAKKEGDKGV